MFTRVPTAILDGMYPKGRRFYLFLTRLKEGLDRLPHLSATVARRTDQGGDSQVLAMKMSGDILCSMALSSTMTVLDVRRAVAIQLTWPLRVAFDGNIYPKEAFVERYEVWVRALGCSLQTSFQQSMSDSCL